MSEDLFGDIKTAVGTAGAVFDELRKRDLTLLSVADLAIAVQQVAVDLGFEPAAILQVERVLRVIGPPLVQVAEHSGSGPWPWQKPLPEPDNPSGAIGGGQ